MFLVDNVDKAVAFYREYPEATLISDKPGNVIAYVYAEEIDKLYERIKDKATVVIKPKDQLYGIREFTIQDPFGFIWTFAQVRTKE